MTGQAIVGAILEGERNPQVLAKLRDPRIKASEEVGARSLEGNWREELLFVLKQDRKNVVEGKRVDLGGRRIIKKKKKIALFPDVPVKERLACRLASIIDLGAADELHREAACEGVVDLPDCFFSSRRRHTRLQGDWSSDVCSSDLFALAVSQITGKRLTYAELTGK